MALSQVFVFNTSDLPIILQLNGSPTSISVPAVNSSNYSPGTPPNPVPFAPQIMPNQFGFGDNSITFTVNDVFSSANIPISTSSQLEWISAQIYFFYKSETTVGWVLLNEGQYVTNGDSAAP